MYLKQYLTPDNEPREVPHPPAHTQPGKITSLIIAELSSLSPPMVNCRGIVVPDDSTPVGRYSLLLQDPGDHLVGSHLLVWLQWWPGWQSKAIMMTSPPSSL